MHAARRWIAPAVALVATMTLGATACSSNNKTKTADTRTSSTAAEAVHTHADHSHMPPVVEITATGSGGHWAFELPEGSITGGVVTLRLTNNSESDPHDFQLGHVDGTHSSAEVLAVVSSTDEGAPTPAWLHADGGVGTAAPGQSAEATLQLPAGHYFYWCNDETDGTGHAGHGMFGEVDVAGDSGASLPTATARIDGFEYGFKVSGLQAGSNLVEFRNTGKELHMVMAAPITPGKTLDDVKAALMSEDESGPPPIDFDKMMSTEVIDAGRSVYSTWDLDPGRYVLLCFMSDRAGGPPHFVLGMIDEVTVS